MKANWFGRACLVGMVLVSELALAERIGFVLPSGSTEEKQVLSVSDTFWGSVLASIAGTAATGGRVVYFPLITPPGSSNILYEYATPGQSPDKSRELFRIHHYNKRAPDVLAETEELVKVATKACPMFPASVIKISENIMLVERESKDCVMPGYRYALSRFLKGSEGLYQVVYLARGSRPSDKIIAEWKARLAQVAVVE